MPTRKKKGGKKAIKDRSGSRKSKRTGKEGPMVLSASVANEKDELVFEDPFGDEFEEEDIEQDENFNEDVEDNFEDDRLPTIQEDCEEDAKVAGNYSKALLDNEPIVPKQVWRPGVDSLDKDEELDFDPSAYVMYHSLRTEWPCLSFDIIKDTLGDNRQRFPLTMFMITGSQADRADRNKISLLKLSDLHKTQAAIDSDNESEEDDEDLDDDPTIEHVNIHHQGGVNRIRSCPHHPGLVVSMADSGLVHLFDLTFNLRSMMSPASISLQDTHAHHSNNNNNKPIFSFSGHSCEGFAVDWSPVAGAARLATGDCSGRIHIWNASQLSAANWTVDNTAYSGHTGSVEDLQWSPSEQTVFASASADCSVKIWDTRGKNGSQLTWQAHSEDVNVISWNKSVGYLLASGSDDGSFKVWDLRAVSTSKAAACLPLAYFTYHKGPITSIEWASHDESVISVSSADNQVTVWDLSVEADEDAARKANAVDEDSTFPPQLLFIHQGQYNVKEIHFHPQIPGVIVSTAEDGFNVFKPAISVSS